MNSDLVALDDKFRESFSFILERSFLLFHGVVRYYQDLVHYFDDLQHWAIWMAGVYLMLLVQLLEDTAIIRIDMYRVS